MKKSFVLRSAIAASISAIPLLADFTYEQTSQITGGAMLQMVRMAGAFSKSTRKMTEPIPTTVSIKGNRMVRKSPDEATVIDLDQQTITTIHFANKAYSVTTFEQLKQQMAAMAERMKSHGAQQPDTSFDVKVNDTGQTKAINGNSAHEMIMTITATSTDPKSGGQGALNIVSNMWIAPNVPGYAEARDFQRRMAETLGWVPGENPMISRPDMVKAMSQVYKEGSKLDGMPVTTTVRMGGAMQGATGASDETQASDKPKQEAAPAPTSVGDALTGALGSHFGLGRRKKRAADSETTDQNSPAQKNDTKQADASLLEVTSEVTSYNSGAVDPAVFQVPPDFSKIDEEILNPRKHR